MRRTGPPRTRPVIGAAVGFAGVFVLNAFFVIVDPEVTRAVPLLLLFIPITIASVVGGWKASAPLALLTAAVYSFHFVAPIGAIRLGFTEDTFTMIIFVAVALFLSEVGRRRDAARAERERQRAVLLRAVSHDLRNPLGTIRAASAQLRGTTVRDVAARDELLDLVVEESDRLDRIIRNLLSLSRIEAGSLAPDQAAEPLAEILEQSVQRFRRPGARRGAAQILLDVPDDLPDVLVDRTQIDQVVTNLIENALRHGAGREGDGVVRIVARALRHEVRISVSDQGPGFAPELKAAAFSTPYRSPVRTGGEGIGLTVCKAIVEAHRGSITADDEPGGGARVEFTVPTAG